MLFWLALAAAEYFQFGEDQEKYIGLIDGTRLGKVDERKALSFLRQQADEQRVYTILKSNSGHKNSTVTFNQNDEMILGSGTTKFLILLNEKGKYILMADDKCVVEDGTGLKRVSCSSSQNIALFDIKAFTTTTAYTRRSIIELGPKTDKFNPEDPLANEIYEGIPAGLEDAEKVMLPYTERLKDKPAQDITSPSEAKLVLAKFNVF